MRSTPTGGLFHFHPANFDTLERELLVMDQFARRITGFAVHSGIVDGMVLCRMFRRAIRGQSLPKYLSSDHDPLYRFHQWQANLRVLGVREVKTVPYVPLSHPFVERLIGTVLSTYSPGLRQHTGQQGRRASRVVQERRWGASLQDRQVNSLATVSPKRWSSSNPRRSLPGRAYPVTKFGHVTPCGRFPIRMLKLPSARKRRNAWPYNESVLSASKMPCLGRPAICGEQIGGAHMRIDLYTKVILTVIALLLAVFTLKPVLQPHAVMAQGNFGGIQFSYSGGNHAFFNANTGDVWEYGDHGNFRNHYKVHELGKDHGR